ncbi:MAG: type II and III secretion system protein family protein [Gammaproteobacteria bacterium]
MIKKRVIGCLLLLWVTNGFANDRVELYVGEIKILKVDGIKRVAVGNSSVLSTSMLNNGQLLLIAEGEGDSNVHVWLNSGKEQDIAVHIKAVYASLAKKAGEVKTLLADIKGLKVRMVGEHIVLSGMVGANYATAIDTVKGTFEEIMDLTQKGVMDLSNPGNKMVYMNIKITEFNRNFLDKFGIDWDTTLAGPSAALAVSAANNNTFRATSLPAPSFAGDLLPLTGKNAVGFFGIATEITSRINLAVNSGNALILAEPRLVARSGGEATFLAGGEVPLPISSIGGSNVEFKEFGISLSIKPVVDRYNNIRANVQTEISAVDNSVAVQGIPGFLTRRTGADISLHSGETLVMSGLVNQQASKDITGLKFLGNLPILGPLFHSKNFRDQKSELVIFVTPTVYNADSEINKASLRRQKELVESFKKAVDESRLDIIE